MDEGRLPTTGRPAFRGNNGARKVATKANVRFPPKRDTGGLGSVFHPKRKLSVRKATVVRRSAHSAVLGFRGQNRLLI
jgi:hypothetical protein